MQLKPLFVQPVHHIILIIEYEPPVFTRICTSVVVALSFFFMILTFPVTCFIAIKVGHLLNSTIIFES